MIQFRTDRMQSPAGDSHVRVRLFAGPPDATLARAGSLTFTRTEAAEFEQMVLAYEERRVRLLRKAEVERVEATLADDEVAVEARRMHNERCSPGCDHPINASWLGMARRELAARRLDAAGQPAVAAPSTAWVESL